MRRRKKGRDTLTVIYRDIKKNVKVMSQGSKSKPIIVTPINDKLDFELETDNPKLKPFLKNGKLSFIVRSSSKRENGQEYNMT